MATIIDGRRARGDRTRGVVLERATQLASVEGLSGLSIAGVAEAAAISKSGVATLFGSKERLELAVVAEAERIFVATVVEPARELPRGIGRIALLVDLWLRYSEDRVFVGGCFFAAVSAEFDSRPGHVRDAIADARHRWTGYVQASVQHAIDAGELRADTDAAQLAFELEALMDFANARSLLDPADGEPYRRARRAAADRLLAAGADAAALEPLGV